MPKSIIVQIESLAKTYPREDPISVIVFDRFSVGFIVQQVTAVLGPTGCGKTTLLNLISGLVEPDSGSVTFPSHTQTPSIGTVLQKDLLLPWRNVDRNLRFGLELKGNRQSEDLIRSMRREFRLEGYTRFYPDELSGGLRQKVSLLRTLLFEPELVLLDEPFANIDYYQKLDLESLLVQWIRNKQRSSVFVTHDVEEAIAVADRVIVLSDKPARVVLDLPIEFGGANCPDPVRARRHPRFGQYLEKVWSALKDPNEKAS